MYIVYVVDNAVIMAAGTSSRFAPLSYEMPKALIPVKGEVLIERQIRQLIEAGVPSIYIVVGYKGEMFSYLQEKYGVHILWNHDYLIRNNHASIFAARKVLGNTYICSADNYFSENPFEKRVSESYYAAVYADGPTKEWCMETDEQGWIKSVKIGGENAWYMMGHAFWSADFSRKFLEILNKEYEFPQTVCMLWESMYIQHIHELNMKIRRYDSKTIFEFDTLDELREFDKSYLTDTRSRILREIAMQLTCDQRDICKVTAYKGYDNSAAGFTFICKGKKYVYSYENKHIKEIV